jgi:uncharacterized protein (TIGR02145 family)
MKTKLWIFTLAMICASSFLISSCKKDDDNSNTVKDLDSNVYHTVIIGTQTWMVENLKTTKYRNGDLIRTTTPATLDIRFESAPKYQWAFVGHESNVTTYGRLYTWYAVTDGRNVCPTGWHVPTDAEWTTLTTFLGGESVASGKLEEIGTKHWVGSNTGADNSSGFTALPGGYRNDYGTFEGMSIVGHWWSSTEFDTTSAWLRAMVGSDGVLRFDSGMKNGFSVRCLQDN